MKEDIKKQILEMKDEDLFLITYYAKKYREIITRKGKTDHKTKTWTTPKGNLCFCYHDLDAEPNQNGNQWRMATNPTSVKV